MRLSRLFSQTQRETPSEAEIASHRLLLRAGYIRQLASGVFSYLPLARLSMTKIEAILRQEMNAIGGQEITMPIIHPASLWQETGRWYAIDSEMGRFRDRNDRDMVLAMTHEEVLADLTRNIIRTRRQLPCLVYHIQTKWRDDPRPRAGLIRVREFTMKDSYSLDADWEGLEQQYQAHYQAYHRIFDRCGLPVVAVQADTGMMGGKTAHEFMYLTAAGEDTLVLCSTCDYAANRQVALFAKPAPQSEEPGSIEPVATPDCKTIADLASFLKIPESRTAKAIFMIADIPQGNHHPNNEVNQEQFIFAVVRGDMELNETKLSNVVGARYLRPATEAEIRSIGAEPGYASPIGIDNQANPRLPVEIVVDDLVAQSPNLVSGANKAGFHLKNVNYGRDYSAQFVADIVAARDGDRCFRCDHPLYTTRAVEVGNIFQLGTRYSEDLGCFFTDTNGEQKPILMGSYGIGVGRLLACIAEEHHDEHGLIWPASVAPMCVHMVLLPGRQSDNSLILAADQLYNTLEKEGIEVLFDDRPESPGVKFNDADLIGIPLRLTVSERLWVNREIEIKRREKPERNIIPISQAVAFINKELGL
jgi:prolyl-tRNA synthetase